ncbi:hypothetical protein [Actinacidiphila oryziradicis]|uniref:Uncharacterized protein n=1 Tax=Actinacidiphila oryziradicis TaxID=2571141 RepID=A0A4U0SQ95_9ACTN|nr:hypothetical protein [Actinacidiphila oryziradicis]TKA11498.1 hypothetical protein FCI23_11780 [Actinacidiphila oryziradicis]
MDGISSIGNPAARWPRLLVTTSLLSAIALLASYGLAPPPAQAAQGRATADTTIVNADAVGHQISRFDVDRNSLDAHDGSVLKVGNLYYLYGTSYA